ncbi:hypothetical protein OH77DRAFT_1594358 [Trametes cingulata]|nr:hypothetical protein OH77DRAFT_1594358 [Trametes cingulata]
MDTHMHERGSATKVILRSCECVYRGRTGDWLKVVPGFCDTKNMEEIVRKNCADLVHEVVVVGTGRAFPCLIVESTAGNLTEVEHKDVSEKILQRISEFNKGLFPHERIQDPKRILVVEKGTLPRTREKGNVRRGVTEELFARQLDAIYNAM